MIFKKIDGIHHMVADHILLGAIYHFIRVTNFDCLVIVLVAYFIFPASSEFTNIALIVSL